MRVIIFTGSRNLRLPQAIGLVQLVRELMDEQAYILVGDCPTGLDRHVRRITRLYDRRLVYLAQWVQLGRKAGPMRNTVMVDAAVELAIAQGVRIECFAYPLARSRGTRDCMKKAAAAGAVVTSPMEN